MRRSHVSRAHGLSARLALALWAVLGALACGKDQTAAPAETCTKVAEQCKLPGGGALGVCNQVPCKAGETAPCLRCMPQH
jgi:hypothetical protein